ncbi:hypothetical protein Zm00014a_015832 [Zea mays]|uniref:Synaptotagmin-2 n=1 Tax=Zea mays TaxID=4577 RepID=A0A317Y226_MAIZE|nr:Synaptotagmin-2 [Zea mays]PWZ52678.1 hypothetical protein Zm00014a_015832 [Zea mays]
MVYILATQREKWGDKVYLENGYYLHGYWGILVDRYEEMLENYKPGLGDHRWPLVTHFVGCKPCGKFGDYPVERCLKNMDRAFNFGDNQILQMPDWMSSQRTGTYLVTLKPLVPTFPCFAKILVSLMEKPHVDFGLKILGADVMAIPGLYRFVQETIKKQVAIMYLWPKALEVPIMDPSKGVLLMGFKSPRASKKPVGILLVKVVRAQKLRKKDLLGKSDPYVKLKMSDDKLPSKKTTVKRSNLNPEWDEEFKFVVTDPESQSLEVGKHEKMGMNMVPLKDLPLEETKFTTLNLLKTMDPNDVQNEKSRGQLTLEVTYKPFKEADVETEDTEGTNVIEKAPDGTPAGGGLLYVIVHEAKDLEGKHHTNPYAKIIFKGEEKKTRVIKKNRDPRWEDGIEFVCEEPPVNDKLHVEVLSKAPKKGLIYGKETLGYIDVNLADVISNKRINEKYHLIDSKNGQIQIELQWRTS